MSIHEPASLTYRFLHELNTQLDGDRDAQRVLKLALRMTREFFEADEACIATRVRGDQRVELRFRLPKSSAWDPPVFLELLLGRTVEPTPSLLVAVLKRRERPWAVMALRRTEREFAPEDSRALELVAKQISRVLRRIDEQRIAGVRAKIDRKIMEELRPKDLFYQILHGLRSLTRYDHSAALLIMDESPGALEVVAEQIAWEKRKSQKIGLTRSLDAGALALLESGDVLGFDRRRGTWQEWQGRDTAGLADVLDYNDDLDVEGREGSILCAPLVNRDGVVGVLKVAARHAGSQGSYEAGLVGRFLPQVVVAMQNQRRNESLEIGMLEAEKKHAVANLARGVSHDINNAFGDALPLVQQLIEEVQEGEVDRETLARDLQQVENSLQACRRIFGGMLAFAVGPERSLGEGDLRAAVDNTLSILSDSMRRHNIRVKLGLNADLPQVRGRQSDLDQLVLNLATNARDSMAQGGDLTLSAQRLDGQVQFVIQDTGIGIPPESLAIIQEPFFTTKSHGNGLGLSICRSIIWNLGGNLQIDSEPGRGTTVRVRLPAKDDEE